MSRLKVVFTERGAAPDDGVQAFDLRRALQHAERLGQRLRLLSRGQERPETGERRFRSKGFTALFCCTQDGRE